MKLQLITLNTMVCATLFCCAVTVHAQDSSLGPQYHGTGITTGADGQRYDRAGSPLTFGGPSNATAVFVGGESILRVHCGLKGLTAEQRAGEYQDRVNQLLGEGPIRKEDITIRRDGESSAVFVKGRLTFTADPQSARANGTTTRGLATVWADRLKEVLPDITAPH